MNWLLMALVALLIVALLAIGWNAWGAHVARRETAQLAERLWTGPSAPPHSRGETLFYESQVAELPEVVGRYFQWTFDDGLPVASAARLQMVGRIRLGRGKPWMPKRSHEVIRAGEGFLWSAQVEATPSISGSDCYAGGQGAMQWRLLGIFPVVSASHEQITRSARWRFVAEYLFIPGALLPSDHVRWEPVNDHRARVTVIHDNIPHPMQIDFDPEGMPRKISFQRWGDFETEGGVWQEIPYAVRCEGVFRKDGYSLPRQYTAYWWADTEREIPVVELEITDAEFR